MTVTDTSQKPSDFLGNRTGFVLFEGEGRGPKSVAVFLYYIVSFLKLKKDLMYL